MVSGVDVIGFCSKVSKGVAHASPVVLTRLKERSAWIVIGVV